MLFFYFIWTSFTLETFLSSNNKTFLLRPTSDCTCELAVFPYNNEDLHLFIKGFSQNIVEIELFLEKLNTTETKIVLNSIAEYQINVSNYAKYNNETIEIIQIKMYEKNNRGEIVFVSVEDRKVYLMRDSEDYKYVINVPINAVWLTQLLSFIIVVLLSHNTKYRKIKPLNFNVIFSSIFVLFHFLVLYLNLSNHQLIMEIIVSIFAFLWVSLFIFDLLLIKIYIYSIAIILAALISGLIVFLNWTLFIDAWYLDDIIVICLLGTLCKFMIIRRLKEAIFPLIIIWLCFTLNQFILLFHIANYEHTIELTTYALYLQIPALSWDGSLTYPCSAFSIFKLIVIGIVFNYSVRLDNSLNCRFYRLGITIISFFCLLVELAFAFVVDDIPVFEYFGVILFVPLVMFYFWLSAFKRGEELIVWHGHFYDISTQGYKLFNSVRLSETKSKTSVNDELLVDSS